MVAKSKGSDVLGLCIKCQKETADVRQVYKTCDCGGHITATNIFNVLMFPRQESMRLRKVFVWVPA